MARSNLVNATDVELAADVAGADTEIQVTTPDLLPAVPFYLVIDPFGDTTREYLRCTAVNADLLTVERNLDGTQSTTHTAGDIVRITYVAQILSDLWAGIEAPTSHAELTNVTADQHHAKYTDAEAVAAVGPHFSALHADLTDISADQHHTRYTDAEAVAAIGTPWTSYLPLAGGNLTGDLGLIGNYVGASQSRAIILKYSDNPSSWAISSRGDQQAGALLFYHSDGVGGFTNALQFTTTEISFMLPITISNALLTEGGNWMVTWDDVAGRFYRQHVPVSGGKPIALYTNNVDLPYTTWTICNTYEFNGPAGDYLVEVLTNFATTAQGAADYMDIGIALNITSSPSIGSARWKPGTDMPSAATIQYGNIVTLAPGDIVYHMVTRGVTSIEGVAQKNLMVVTPL